TAGSRGSRPSPRPGGRRRTGSGAGSRGHGAGAGAGPPAGTPGVADRCSSRRARPRRAWPRAAPRAYRSPSSGTRRAAHRVSRAGSGAMIPSMRRGALAVLVVVAAARWAAGAVHVYDLVAGDEREYTVAPGDTVWGITGRFTMNRSLLEAWNP